MLFKGPLKACIVRVAAFCGSPSVVNWTYVTSLHALNRANFKTKVMVCLVQRTSIRNTKWTESKRLINHQTSLHRQRWPRILSCRWRLYSATTSSTRLEFKRVFLSLRSQTWRRVSSEQLPSALSVPVVWVLWCKSSVLWSADRDICMQAIYLVNFIALIMKIRRYQGSTRGVFTC